MRTRTSIVIISIIFFIGTVGFAWYIMSAPVAPASVSSTSTPTPSASPTVTVTLTPTLGQKIGNTEHDIFDPLLALLQYFAALMLSALVLLLFLRIWNLSGKSNLVIDNFNNATGNDALNKELLGLNQLTREFLARELEEVQQLVNKYNDQGLDHFTPCPPPETATDTQLATILKSLTDVSAGETKIAVQLLNIVLIPSGTKVITTLHSLSEVPVLFGLSFEIMDLEGNAEPVAVTFWETSRSPEGGQYARPGPVAALPAAPAPAAQLAVPAPGMAAQPPVLAVAGALPALAVQLAQTYYELGTQLDSAGLYEEAITYYEMALKQDGSFNQAVVSLGATLSHLQIQRSGVSAYTISKQLQDVGLLPLAIESYKQPILPQDQVDAVSAWETILKLRQGDEANAYFLLAEFYKKDGVYLFDQSLDLYKMAIARGSQQALVALQMMQQREAECLVRAAQILFELKQFNDAEKYANTALAKRPENTDAQSLSPLIDKDARASYVMGQIYERRGALDEAMNQYEAALKRQPDYEEALAALKRVLQKRRTPDQRFLDLMKPAVRWLAIEIALRSMEDQRWAWNHFLMHGWGKNRWHTNYQAKLYNFIGYFHQLSATMFFSYPQFYKRAITIFNKASHFDEKWFLPPLNLGVTYVMMAQGQIEQQTPLRLNSMGIESIYQSLSYFGKAQDLFDKHKNEQSISREKLSETNRMIKLYISVAQVLSNDATLIQRATVTIRDMRNGWNLNKEKDSHILYNLACWYGIADSANIGIAQARHEARYVITICLVCEPDFLTSVSQEPALKSISDKAGWKKLSNVLRQERNLHPDLLRMPEIEFGNVIDHVLQQMHW